MAAGPLRRRLGAGRALDVVAAAEALTGLALILSPAGVGRALLAPGLEGAGLTAGRVAGFALLALGASCWRRGPDVRAHGAMLVYSLLVAVDFTMIGAGGRLVGPLLWPAATAHWAMALLLGAAIWSMRRRGRQASVAGREAGMDGR